jgi:hypothetical protein
MFANTLTLTINAVAKVLNRINQDNYGSSYRFTSADGQEIISLVVRHSVDTAKGNEGPIARHNVFIERTIAATPTTAKKYWSVTYTLRDLQFSGPAELDLMSVGALTLLGTLDTGLTVGEN